MRTKAWAIFLMLLCALVLTFAQISWKIGSGELTKNPLTFINKYIIIGFILYGISGILFIISLKGGELTVIHPLISLSIIGVALITPLFIENEMMTFTKWFGVSLNLAGVFLITIGSRKGGRT